MKTSKILLAMALPVAFAACTSEEIVESNNVNLQNREVLPVLTAVVESGVDSRFSWNEETFGWNKFTAEDQFAAGLTDATLWDVQDLMMTNYIYTDQAGNGAYTTTSQMVEGTYFFYSFPGFENVASRQGVPFDLTTQKSVDFKKPTAAVEANQLFVSALYKLEAATANKALPIKFVSYWSTAGMKIKNTTGDDMKIVRMMITADKAMPLKGILAPSKLGDAAKKNSDVSGLVYYNNGTNYVLPYDATAEENPEWDDIKIVDMAKTDVEGGLAEESMMLTVENGELADDEEATVYFQMPAGEYEKVTVTFFVEVPTVDDETEIKQLEAVEFAKNAKDDEEEEENNLTVFYRGGTTAVFGVEAGKIAAHEVTELDILSATEAGAYAASYEDLVDIIKAGNELRISNMGDLKIDDAVIALFKSTTAKKNLGEGEFYVFNNPVEITTAKTAVQKLENIQVADATITAGKFSVDYNLAGAVKVGEGAELTIKCTQSGKITNAGTVNIAKASTTNTADGHINVEVVDAATTNYKPTTSVNLTIGGNGTYVGSWDASKLNTYYFNAVRLTEYPTNLTFNGSKNAQGVAETSLYVIENVTVPYGKNLYIGEGAEVGNEANATLKSEFKINGYAENKGTVTGATIYGAWNSTTGAANGATVDNYGLLNNAILGVKLDDALSSTTEIDEARKDAVANATVITNKVETANVKNMTLATAGNNGLLTGKVDNNIGGFYSGSSEVEVYATVSENESGKINISDINTLYVKNMTWTDAEVSENIVNLYMEGVTLTNSNENPLNESAKLKFDASKLVKVELKDCVVNYGLAVMKGQNVERANIEFNVDGSEFKGGLEYDGEKMVDVTVKGMFTTNATALNWAGVTLNKITLGNTVVTTTIENVANMKADYSAIGSYTVKTTTLNDKIENDATLGVVTVKNDAVLTVKNGVKVTATSVTVNGADADISTSKKGVLNLHGECTVTPTGAGTINQN